MVERFVVGVPEVKVCGGFVVHYLALQMVWPAFVSKSGLRARFLTCPVPDKEVHMNREKASIKFGL